MGGKTTQHKYLFSLAATSERSECVKLGSNNLEGQVAQKSSPKNSILNLLKYKYIWISENCKPLHPVQVDLLNKY